MAATVERAECVDDKPDSDVQELPMEEVNTPGTKTIEEVAAYLGLDKKQTIKSPSLLSNMIMKAMRTDTLQLSSEATES